MTLIRADQKMEIISHKKIHIFENNFLPDQNKKVKGRDFQKDSISGEPKRIFSACYPSGMLLWTSLATSRLPRQQSSWTGRKSGRQRTIILIFPMKTSKIFSKTEMFPWKILYKKGIFCQKIIPTENSQPDLAWNLWFHYRSKRSIWGLCIWVHIPCSPWSSESWGGSIILFCRESVDTAGIYCSPSQSVLE